MLQILTTSENFWIGIKIETQKQANEYIPILLQTQARKRFVIVNPKSEFIDLKNISIDLPSKTGQRYTYVDCLDKHFCGDTPFLGSVNWVICQEGIRKWITKLNNQCLEAQVPFLFLKEWQNILSSF